MYIEKEQRWGSSFKGWRICWFFYGECLYLLGEVFFFDFLGLCLLNKFVVMYWKGLFLGDVFHFVGFVDTRYMEFFVERGRPSFFRGAFKREKKYGFSEGIGFRFFGYCF